MRKRSSVLGILVSITIGFIIIMCSGCNNKADTCAASFIKNKNDIERIEIFIENEGTANTKITSKELIDKLLNELSSVNIIQLSKNDETIFLENGKKMLEPGMLTVFLYEKEYVQSGQFFIWSNGEICLLDLDSMKNSKRTISYVSEEKHPNIYKILQSGL